MLTDFIGVPCLSDQLAQTAHNLVTFVIGDVAVVELLEAAIYFNQFVNQGATGDFGWVCGQH